MHPVSGAFRRTRWIAQFVRQPIQHCCRAMIGMMAKTIGVRSRRHMNGRSDEREEHNQAREQLLHR